MAKSSSVTHKACSVELVQQLKKKLADQFTQLSNQHLRYRSADSIVAARCQHIDHILRTAWANHIGAESGLSLLAVGGYGRGELNLYSDIDLLILCPDTHRTAHQQTAEQFVQMLWDIGLEVGHSMRSIDDCIALGRDDIGIATNMLEARLLAGNKTDAETLQSRLRADDFWPPESFYNAKYNEQRERHARFDDTAYKLEPNIKSSPGGLRDLQTIAWIANRVYRTSDFASLKAHGFINQEELDTLRNARNTLWRLRNGLHLLCGRAEDRLLIGYQQDLAEQLGYVDDTEKLAVEKLMQAYYLAVKDIRHLNDLLLQHFDQSINFQGEPVIKAVDSHFHLINDYVAARELGVFEKRPSALLEIFKIYQNQLNIRGIDAETVRAIKAYLPKIDNAYRKKPEHAAIFLSFFQHENRLTHTLRKLDAYGVLAAYIPEYAWIVGRMQHDLFHAYTVDAHILMVVRNVRRLLLHDDIEEIPHPSELIQKAQKRYRLYLAALFHDIAKGRGGDHDAKGAADARQFCVQLGLEKSDAEYVAWLVLNHLLMSKTSQREDISDPKVIAAFAEKTGDQDHLDGLYLLTVADIRGTSHSTWTPWKGHLLKDLYLNATHFFTHSTGTSAPSVTERLTLIKQEARHILGKNVQPESLKRFWGMLDDDYFLNNPSHALAWHAREICNAQVLDLPIVESRYESALQAETYMFYTADSEQLLGAITGTLDRLNQNIVDARIYAAHPGYKLLLFTVTYQHPDTLSDADIEKHIATLKAALIEHTTLLPPVKRMLPSQLKGFKVETHIKFEDLPAQNATLMQLTTLDRPGLMHRIANVLAQCHIKLVSAKIATVGEKVEDVFRVTDAFGQALATEEQKKQLARALRKALSEKA